MRSLSSNSFVEKSKKPCLYATRWLPELLELSDTPHSECPLSKAPYFYNISVLFFLLKFFTFFLFLSYFCKKRFTLRANLTPNPSNIMKYYIKNGSN